MLGTLEMTQVWTAPAMVPTVTLAMLAGSVMLALYHNLVYHFPQLHEVKDLDG